MNPKSLFQLPSFDSIVFVVIFTVLLTSIGNGLLGDGDTGYHIRAGNLILRTLTIPETDPFSHIIPKLTWTAHEWLSEVLTAVIHNHAGLTGIVVF